jgi:glycosyltransferase involved in cell wall biosynthesis
MQVVKMAQALSKCTDNFSLVTSGDVGSLLGFNKPDLNRWYGITHPFNMVQLPLRLRSEYPLPRGYQPFAFARASALYLALRRPDLVYSRTLEIVESAIRIGLNAIYETHSADLEGERIRGLLATGRLRAIVTIADYLKDLYGKECGIPEEKILVCSDGVDLEPYGKSPSKREQRANLGLPQDRYIAVYAGHLYDDRGIEEILECARSFAEVFFLVVGGYPEDVQRRESEVRQLGLKNVQLTGFVSNALIPQYLEAADCLLMLYSRNVATAKWMSPLKLFEYMGAERPIIASDLPSIRTVLQHGSNAYLVEPDSAESLKAGIEQMLASPQFGQVLASQARSDVEAWTWDRRADKILNFAGI